MAQARDTLSEPVALQLLTGKRFNITTPMIGTRWNRYPETVAKNGCSSVDSNGFLVVNHCEAMAERGDWQELNIKYSN